MTRTLLACLLGCLAALPAQPSLAQPVSSASAIETGRRIVLRDCSGCHAVGRTGRSPLPKAPMFRNLHKHYDVEDLAESLAEGIVAGHPAMPSNAYEAFEVRAIIAYLKSLEPRARLAKPARVKPAT